MLWLSVGALGCTQRSNINREPEPGPPLRVEYGRCVNVLRGPICETDGPLAVWVRTATTAIVDLELDGVRLEGSALRQGGRTYDLVRTASVGEVRVVAVKGSGASRFQLAVRRVTARDNRAISKTALEFDDENQRRAFLDGLPPDTRSWVLGYLGRRAKVALDQRLNWLEEAEHLHSLAGWISDANRARGMRGRMLLRAARLSEARATLAPLGPEAQGNPWEARFAWRRLGFIALEAGDPRASRRYFEQNDQLVRRIGGPNEQLWSRLTLAEASQLVGRWQDALNLSKEALALANAAERCDKSSHLHNIGWIELLRREADAFRKVRSGIDPLRLLEQAAKTGRGCMFWEVDEASLLLDFGLATLQDGDFRASNRYLTRARRVGVPPQYENWAQHLEGRVAVAEGRFHRARAIFDRLLVAARKALDPTTEWRALVGRGQAMEGLKRAAQARADYEQAEALLDERTIELSLGAGRADFTAVRGLSARLLIDLLVRMGETTAAVEAARRSRSRPLRTARLLDRISRLPETARRDWESAVVEYAGLRRQLDRDAARDLARARTELEAAKAARRELRDKMNALLARVLKMMERSTEPLALSALPDGVLGLLVHPGRSRFWVFAFDGGRVETRAVEPDLLHSGDAIAVGRAVLAPFWARIKDSSEVRLYLHEWPSRFEPVALPVNGVPLIQAAPVTFGLDLAPAEARLSDESRVLIVSDPRGDLPGAARESRRLANLMKQRGRDVVLLAGDDATAEATRSTLETASQFHYAGHAHVDVDRLESSLHLAKAERLTVGDVLVLPRVPDVVVLSGCETAGTPSDKAREVDLGLAQAFLIRGARHVLATSRPVTDDLAEAVSTAVHQQGPVTPSTVQRAMRRVSRAYPREDWTAYRLYVR